LHQAVNWHFTCTCNTVLVARENSAVEPWHCPVQVQLSCYGDAIGGDLKSLKAFLDTKVKGESFAGSAEQL